jgi:hypothetical protein
MRYQYVIRERLDLQWISASLLLLDRVANVMQREMRAFAVNDMVGALCFIEAGRREAIAAKKPQGAHSRGSEDPPSLR